MARDIAIIPARETHIDVIAAKIRASDRDTLALLGWCPETAMRLAYRGATVAWTGTLDGVPICMFGLSKGELREGRPWLLATPELQSVSLTFWRLCRAEIDKMLEISPVLSNYVPVCDQRAVKWLRRLGAEIGEPIPWGPKRGMFHRWTIRRP